MGTIHKSPAVPLIFLGFSLALANGWSLAIMMGAARRMGCGHAPFFTLAFASGIPAGCSAMPAGAHHGDPPSYVYLSVIYAQATRPTTADLSSGLDGTPTWT